MPGLAELQPELFCEVSPELASEKGIDTEAGRGSDRARGDQRQAMVTDACGRWTVPASCVHHVGLPWHWGYQGLVTGASANDLFPSCSVPNVTSRRSRRATCNVGREGSPSPGDPATTTRRGLAKLRTARPRSRGMGFFTDTRSASAARPARSPARMERYMEDLRLDRRLLRQQRQLNANTWRHVPFIEQSNRCGRPAAAGAAAPFRC